MPGTYKINDCLYKNIITNAGKLALLNNIAGKRSGFCSSIAVGIGSTTATINDTSLAFVTGGSSVNTSIVDAVNEKIYFKTTLPSTDQYYIYELGCYSSNINSQHNGTLLISFGELTNWTSSSGSNTVDSSNNRIGSGSIAYALAASATATGSAPMVIDLSNLSGSTLFKLAYQAHNLSNIYLRFKTDNANYFQASFPTTEGYNINSVTKSSFATTGSPSWSTINFIEVSATANSSGGSILLDGCRYDTPVGFQAGELLSRVVLPTPQHKLVGVTMDIEYEVDISI